MCVSVRARVSQIGTVQVPIHSLLSSAKGKQKKAKAHKVNLSTDARWSRDKDGSGDGGGGGGGDGGGADGDAGEKYKDTAGTPHRQESVQEDKERARKLTAAQVKGARRKSFSELAHLQRSKACTLVMSATKAPVVPVTMDLFLIRYVHVCWPWCWSWCWCSSVLPLVSLVLVLALVLVGMVALLVASIY